MPLNEKLSRRSTARARNPKTKALVCLEGAATERDYINGLRRLLRNSNVVLKVGNAEGVPLEVVRSAVKRQREERSDPFDIAWCILDVESPEPHPTLEQALRIARENHIRCVLSNPCFELWLTLHITDCTAFHTTSEMQKKAERTVPGYCAKRFNFDAIAPYIAEAEERASRLHRGAPEHLDWNKRNPSTSMWEFIRFLRQEGWSPPFN